MPDRRQPPPVFPIRSLLLPPVTKATLDNGLPVYCITDPKQEVLKMEGVFRAGRPYEEAPMIARQAQLMLRAGSKAMGRDELAEQLDFLGSSLSLPFHLDTSQVAVYGLRKHLEKMMPLLVEVLFQPAFPDDELSQLVERQEARLAVELGKNEVLAYRQITEWLFGAHHPYGYNSTPEGYRSLDRDQLVRHHERLYHPGNLQLFIGGNIQESDLALLNRFFGQLPVGPHVGRPVLPISPRPSQAKQIITGRAGGQSAIRLGRRLFTRDHSDYAGLYVLNTVLGGYFGSRLMTNIREEKGLTYNIYSSLDMMHYDGMWLIGCEVSPEHTQTALGEIEREMSQLQTEGISEKELDMVRSYLLGNILTMLDGPLNSMEIVLTLETEGLSRAFFAQWIDRIIHITPREVQALARQYLSTDDWVTLVVEGTPGDNAINTGQTTK